MTVPRERRWKTACFRDFPGGGRQPASGFRQLAHGSAIA
jgi:hypothetical protein